MNKKLAFIFTLTILFCLYIFLLSTNYAKSVSANLSSSVFRLHIIANSDSEEDQNLKLLVRDNIINYMNTLISNSNSKNDIISIVSNHIEDFKNIAFDIGIDSVFHSVGAELDYIQLFFVDFGIIGGQNILKLAVIGNPP